MKKGMKKCLVALLILAMAFNCTGCGKAFGPFRGLRDKVEEKVLYKLADILDVDTNIALEVETPVDSAEDEPEIVKPEQVDVSADTQNTDSDDGSAFVEEQIDDGGDGVDYLSTKADHSQEVYDTYYSEGYIFPNSDSAYLSYRDYSDMQLYEIRRGLNEIYARHGRRFSNEGQAAYFEKQSWYYGTTDPSDFNEGVFNDYEKENIKTLTAALDKYTDGRSASSEEKMAIEFLQEAGVNAFLNFRFDSPVECGGNIMEIIYQMTDPTVDYNKLIDAIEEEDEWYETDVTYMSGKELDNFLVSVTGKKLYEGNWDCSTVGYIESMDTYYVQHGDTNYMTFHAEIIDMKGDDTILLVEDDYGMYGPCVISLHKSFSGYQFVTIY